MRARPQRAVGKGSRKGQPVSKKFQNALFFVLEHEVVFAKGNYGDYKYVIPEIDPSDAGGLTMWGIDQRSHPTVQIASLKLCDAADIYEREYWDKARCDDMPPAIALVHFDACVNTGIHQAGLWMQRAVGATPDGIVGSITLALMNRAISSGGEKALALRLVEQRESFYNALVKQDPVNKKWINGWLNRTSDVKAKIQTIC